MNAKDAIAYEFTLSQKLINWFLGDFSEEDMLVRFHPNGNHAAWLMGHMIGAEAGIGKDVTSFKYPEVPVAIRDFVDGPTRDKTPAGGYLKKAEYLDWFNKIREQTLQNVKNMTEADLDKPITGPLKDFAPTHGTFLLLMCNHIGHHGGQISVLRRMLGKPVLF